MLKRCSWKKISNYGISDTTICRLSASGGEGRDLQLLFSDLNCEVWNEYFNLGLRVSEIIFD